MPSYRYAGLAVIVTADTRQMARDIARDAQKAGQDAAKQISGPTKKAAEESGKTYASAMSRASSTVGRIWKTTTTNLRWQVGLASRDMQRVMGRTWAAIAKTAAQTWARLPAGITGPLSRAWEVVSGAAGKAASAAAAAWRGIGGPGIIQSFGRAWEAISGAAGRAASAAGSAFTRAAGAAGGAITSTFSRAFESVSGLAARAASAVGGAFSRGADGGGAGGMLGGLIGNLKNMPLLAKGGAAGMALLTGSVLKTGIEYNTLTQRSRAAFTTILGSAPKAEAMMESLTRFARTSPFPRQAYIEGAQQMVSFGISAQRVIPYLRSITDAVAATGGSAQTLGEITLVMSQIQAAGRITGVDLMQFAQRGINAAELIGAAMGKSARQIKDEISTGTFDATRALDALSRGMEKRYGGAAANVKRTWAGTTDSIKGAMRDVGSAIVAPFIDPRGGGLAVEWGNKLATSLRGALPSIIRVMTAFGTVLGFVADGLNVVITIGAKILSWGPIRRIVQGLAIAFGVLAVAILAVSFPVTSITIAILAAIGIIYRYRKAIVGSLIAAWNWMRNVGVAVVGWFKRNWPLLITILLGPIGLAAAGIIRYWTQISNGTRIAFNAVRRVIVTVWNAVRGITAAVLGRIQAIVTAVWTFALTATRRMWGQIGAAIRNAWNLIRNVTSAATGWIRSRISVTWSFAKSTTQRMWSQIGSVFGSAWNRIKNIAQNALNWIRDRVSAVWNTIHNRTRDMWNRTVGAVRSAWDRVVAIVKAPIKTLVNRVVNPLIFGINRLISKIGIPKIPKIVLGFAHGGRIPGGYGGGDRVTIKAEPGEWMLTKEQARSIGYDRLRALPRRPRRRPGHYQHGGEIAEGISPLGAFDFIGKGWNAVVNAGRGIVSEFGKFLREGVAKAFEIMTRPLRKLVEPFAQSPELFKQFFGKHALKIIKGAIEFIRGKEETPELFGGMGIAALAAQVMRRFPQLSITSALRPGDPGYHGKGLARDLGGPVSVMNAAARWIAQRFTSVLLEGIHNPGLSVKNRKKVPPGFWGPATWAGHADHIHIASERSAGPGGTPGMAFGGPATLRRIVARIAQQFGVGWAVNLAMQRIRVESGFNRRAVNNWDINARLGYPSTGLAQLIRPTFQAYSGPYRNRGPFLNGVSLDDWAQIFTMFNYSIRRYGRGGLARAWGGRQGYAGGGILREPVVGLGLHSGTRYSFGEQAPRIPESISPLRGGNGEYPREARRVVINVYPQRGQSETEIAALVSRRLDWAEATGRA